MSDRITLTNASKRKQRLHQTVNWDLALPQLVILMLLKSERCYCFSYPWSSVS